MSTLVASYSSAKLAPPVSAASVETFERRPPDQRPWYTIQIYPCHITIPGSDAMPIPRKSYSIYRRFEDVQGFAEQLENEFPWIRSCNQESSLKARNILAINLRDKTSAWPRMRSRANSTITDAECTQRKSDLDKYLQGLFALDPIISQCRLVAEFFGIWKTDLEAHLSQEIQDPLALHSLVTHPFESAAKTALESPTSNVEQSPAVPVHVTRMPVLNATDRKGSESSQLSCPLWSPPLSSCSSAPTSPSMSPEHNRKGSGFPWEIISPSPLGDILSMSNRSLPSPPGSPYHSSDDGKDGNKSGDGEDEESEDEFESSLEDLDDHSTDDEDSFEMVPPLRIIKKSTSLQNLRRNSRGGPDILSAHENNPQKWQFPEGSFPETEGVVNMGPRTRRPSSFDPEEIRCFKAILSETPLQSKTPSVSKSDHLTTSPLLTRPVMMARTLSASKTDGNAHPYTMIEPPNMTRCTPPLSPATTLPISAANSTKFTLGAFVASWKDQMSGSSMAENENDKLHSISAPIMVSPQMLLTKSLEKDKRGQTQTLAEVITMQEKARMSSTQQREQEIASFPKPPISILRNGVRIMAPSPNHDPRSGIGFLGGMRGKRHDKDRCREQDYTRVTSPIPGCGFLSQHPSAFVATFKIVVDAERIMALQVMDKDEDFVLSVPDLRLRVRNKFARMEMPIPEDFELIWTPWHGEKVVLKNDEELQRAIYSSANNKVTLRCTF
ncbi:hypothetical protein BG011_009722 [Mortierella polycephala]|uniref:PX domain-containing protein n=1 Tax=Mortierella polycephala TaxID=41804 RepID=A0A9P6PNM7_9FUNG|nr:hypothetical protein BG011_009722 [Mortierella polycephala]